MKENEVPYIYDCWIKYCLKFILPKHKTMDELEAYLLSICDAVPFSPNDGEMKTFQSEILKEHFNNEKPKKTVLDFCGYRILYTQRNAQLMDMMDCEQRFLKHTRASLYSIPEGSVFLEKTTETLRIYSIDENNYLQNKLIYFWGVEQKDIDNITPRLIDYVGVMANRGEVISFKDFENSVEMSGIYNFKNVARCMIDLLKSRETEFEILSKEDANVYMYQWIDAFIPPFKRELVYNHFYKSKGRFAGFLWHAFSYKDLPCLCEAKADEALLKQKRDECVIFFNNEKIAFSIKQAHKLEPVDFSEYDDVFFTDINFKWTYCHTHEIDCGPYFHQRLD